VTAAEAGWQLPGFKVENRLKQPLARVEAQLKAVPPQENPGRASLPRASGVLLCGNWRPTATAAGCSGSALARSRQETISRTRSRSVPPPRPCERWHPRRGSSAV